MFLVGTPIEWQNIRQIDPTLCRVRWRLGLEDGIYCSAAVGSDGTVYAGSIGGFLYAVSPDGKIKWQTEVGQGIGSSLALDADDTIYFGRREDYLSAVTADGEEKYQVRTQGDVYSSPVVGPDGTIYMGGGNFLYAFGEKE